MAQQKKAPRDKDAVEKTIVKARNWSFVAYPESLPSDWIERLQQTGLPFCLSPLHDKDVDPTGIPKKPHYHVILCYNGPVTFSNVKKHITDPLGQPHPQYLQSVKGMYRYLTHKDNPDKYQYDETQIKNFGGFDINSYADLTMSEEDRIFDSIEGIIFSNDIKEYATLIFYLKQQGMMEQLSFVRRHTMHIATLLKSLRHMPDKLFEIDEETGEVK